MPDLDDYFDAHADAVASHAAAPDRSQIRRRALLARWRAPLSLASALALFAVALFLGFSGEPAGHLVAAGLALTVLPDRWRALSRARKELAALRTTGEFTAFLRRQALRDRAGAFVNFLGSAFFAVLFCAMGIVAALLGKDWQPGILSGVALGGLAVYELLVSFRRVHRAASVLGEASETSPEEDGSEELRDDAQGGGSPDER